MPSNDPEYTNRTWARHWGGEYIPPTRRDTKYHMIDHPLWAVRRIEDAELYNRMQYIYKNTSRCFPNDKMFIMNLHKQRVDINSDFVIMKFCDFADLAIGRAGEVERESEKEAEWPMAWTMVACVNEE